MKTALRFAQQCISDVLQEGDSAIDATVGNGHDTLFLANIVGKVGHVYGFDIQAQAIVATRARVDEAGCRESVTLFEAGHEQAQKLLPDVLRGHIRAVMFNLGYLPRGDKSLVTRPETTLQAIEQFISFVTPGGRITLVIYEGHPGGQAEGEAVNAFVEGLDQNDVQVVAYHMMNQKNTPPRLIVIEKR